MARTSKIRQDEGDVLFVLDQHAELDLDSASSLKHAAGRHITPPGHIIIISSQSVFVFIPYLCVLSREAANAECSHWFDPTREP